MRDSCVFVAPFILQSEMVVGLTNAQFVNLTESFQWTAKSSNVEQPMPISKPYPRDAKSMSLLKVWKMEPELKFCDFFFRHLLTLTIDVQVTPLGSKWTFFMTLF